MKYQLVIVREEEIAAVIGSAKTKKEAIKKANDYLKTTDPQATVNLMSLSDNGYYDCNECGFVDSDGYYEASIFWKK